MTADKKISVDVTLRADDCERITEILGEHDLAEVVKAIVYATIASNEKLRELEEYVAGWMVPATVVLDDI